MLDLMRSGDVVGDRFEIAHLIGQGAMGEVFRGRDRITGGDVAVKALFNGAVHDETRFAREVLALSEIHHPGVVKYVSHGETPSGRRYVVMEWLEGEGLDQRLRRGRLGVDESVAIALRIAEALAIVHRRGFIHRDLKPSNLFLPALDIELVKLLDFGIARPFGLSGATRTGGFAGTPAYMAPEQARGEPTLTPRVDVFAFGCVFFECLAGVPAFRGENAMAVLAKIMLADTPDIAELRPDVPSRLAQMLRRLLAHDPLGRLADGSAIVTELKRIVTKTSVTSSTDTTPVQTCRPISITQAERRILSVVLIGREPSSPVEAPSTMDKTLRSTPFAPCRKVAEASGGHIELLGDGSMLVTLAGMGLAHDQAARAARCALRLHAQLPVRPMVLSTGQGEVSGRLPIGDVIDRAARRLAILEGSTAPTRALPIAVDDITAGLLAMQFDIRHDETGERLHGERSAIEHPRLLLGKPAPCVGRDREIAQLDHLFEACVEEPLSQAVLILAPAGVGKSRLASEFIRSLRRRELHVEIWSGSADVIGEGSAFGLLGRVLRAACGIGGGEPLAERIEKVRERVTRHVPPADRMRVAEFLGEIIGAPLEDDASPQLFAARRNAQIMREQMRIAWQDFIRAECAAHPVVLVLDDLQWGDLPTVRFLDATLKSLGERPFLVLALARPEANERFPQIWAECRLQTIRLKELTRRASVQLVRQVLGEYVDDATVERLISQADGNAFYLEELILAVSQGKGRTPYDGAALPGTVLAMVQARLEELESDARRLLRAASIFGGTFWPGGLSALLGEGTGLRVIEPWLAELLAREMFVTRPTSRFSGETELAFRHGLLREGAYAMLTEEDRTLGHRLAGQWLERNGEQDAMLLAQHFDRGQDVGQAALHYLRAAEQALRGDDLEAALARSERGVACGASGSSLGDLRRIQAEAHLWRGAPALAEKRATEAAALLPAGTAAWHRAVCHLIIAASKLGDADGIERWGAEVSVHVADAAAISAQIICLSECATSLIFKGRYGAADSLIETATQRMQAAPDLDGVAIAALQQVRGIRALVAGNASACLESFDAALRAATQAGDRRNACTIRSNLGHVLSELGDFESAEQVLRAAMVDADRMGIHDLSAAVLHNLGRVISYRGDTVEGAHLEQQAVEAFERQGNVRMAGCARSDLARIALLARKPLVAEREARAAAAMLVSTPPQHAVALSVLARALLDQRRHDEAIEAAEKASSTLESLGAIEEGEALIRLVLAEALSAAGRMAEATRAIGAARANLLERAAKIADPAWRVRFLKGVPEHSRTLSFRAGLSDAASDSTEEAHDTLVEPPRST